MKFLKSKKFIITLIILIIVIVVVVIRFNNKDQVEYTTEIVKRSNIVQTVSETGTVKAAEEIDLNFQTSGKLEKIYIEIGSEVKKDDILADLDYSDLAIKAKEARANLSIAQANLSKLLTGATTEGVAVLQANVDQAEAAYKSAIDEQQRTEKKEAQLINNAKNNLLSSLEEKLAEAQVALDKVNTVLVDEDAKYNLSVKDLSFKVSAQYDYDSGKALLPVASASLDKAKLTELQNDVSIAVSDNLDLLNITLSALNNCFRALEQSVTSIIFSQTELDAFKTSISAQLTTVNTAIATVLSAKNAFDLSKLSGDQQIGIAQTKIDSAYSSWQVALAKLNEIKAPARQEDIILKQAGVSQARASLESTLNEIEKRQIKSPIDGVITKINYEEGEQTSQAKQVISILGKNNFEVAVDISETDIIKIKEGDITEITFDAFGEDLKFEGRVYFIEPAETVIQDVIYYKVTLSDIKSEADNESFGTEPNLRSGMTANVIINTASKDNVLVMPSRAIVEKNGDGKYVRVFKAGKISERPVQVGLRGDSGLIEVINGVAEGEEVVTFVKEN